MKSPQAIFLIIVIAIGLVLGGYLLNPATAPQTGSVPSPVSGPKDPALVHNDNSPLIGKKDAKAKIVVFSDFLCPYCKTAHDITNSILAKYPDASVEMRNFIVHENSRLLAQAAEAANKQGKYKEMSDLIFAESKQDPSEEYVKGLAQKLGLNVDNFMKDLVSDDIKKQIAKDEEDALALGLQGTPSVFLNNETVDNFNNLESLVNQKLQ